MIPNNRYTIHAHNRSRILKIKYLKNKNYNLVENSSTKNIRINSIVSDNKRKSYNPTPENSKIFLSNKINKIQKKYNA